MIASGASNIDSKMAAHIGHCPGFGPSYSV